MMLADLANHDDVARQRREADPEYATEFDRQTTAGALSLAVVGYPVRRGLSQAALARQLGWSRQQVARVEDGDYVPRSDGLEQLARQGVVQVHIDGAGTVIVTGETTEGRG